MGLGTISGEMFSGRTGEETVYRYEHIKAVREYISLTAFQLHH